MRLEKTTPIRDIQRQTDRQTDRDRQADRQTDRQTDYNEGPVLIITISSRNTFVSGRCCVEIKQPELEHAHIKWRLLRFLSTSVQRTCGSRKTTEEAVICQQHHFLPPSDVSETVTPSGFRRCADVQRCRCGQVIMGCDGYFRQRLVLSGRGLMRLLGPTFVYRQTQTPTHSRVQADTDTHTLTCTGRH